jgi:hypothetical protein
MDAPNPFNVTMPKIWQPWSCPDLIRLGKDNDGGYLVSQNDIMSTQRLVSFGIGCDWIFEQQFTDLAQCPLNAFDERIPDQCEQGLRDFFNCDRKVFKETRIVGSDKLFGTTVAQTCQGQDIFLKCDIEGGEYEILNDLLAMGDIWTGMVIEIHDIDDWNKYNLITGFLSKISLKLLHIHANNWSYWKTDPVYTPTVFELTLGRGKDCVYDPNLSLPQLLDQPNNVGDSDFSIRF